jgi:predicted amidophosphoribosyltransferase
MGKGRKQMISIKPIELKGNWTKGYSLDIHTISSTYLGDDEFGHPCFDTKRSELGELVIRLKYRDDKSVLNDILDSITDFLKNKWKIINTLDYIVPVPPSNLTRKYQPVIEIAEKLSNTIKLPVCIDSLVKVKKTPELKDIVDFEKRKEILEDAFNIQNDCIKGKNILLFDDLYRSGATLQIITGVLYNKGKVKNVYVLTLTKTRSKR